MAIHPIQTSKNTAQPSNKIEVGSLIEYELHGKPILAVVLESRKNKWHVVNETGQELDLAPDRISLVPGRGTFEGTKSAIGAKLKELAEKANSTAGKIDLKEVWEIVVEEEREYPAEELAGLAFKDVGQVEFLATRRALLGAQPYFKRLKTGFSPRLPSVVEELQAQLAVEERKRNERRQLSDAIIRSIKNAKEKLPPQVRHLEELAALGSQAEQAKETTALVEELLSELQLEIRARTEDKALQILIRAGHFSEDVDLELIRARRHLPFRSSELNEAKEFAAKLPEMLTVHRSDESKLRVITIDAEETHDIDDGLSLETLENGYRLGIHISDVATFIQPTTLLYEEALRRGSSVYAPDYSIPMLPPELSEDVISLVAGKPRCAMSFFLNLNSNYEIVSRDVLQTAITVEKRLSYNEVDHVLYGEGGESPTIDRDLQNTLLKLWEISSSFEARRIAQGAVQFNRRELSAAVDSEARVSVVETGEDLPARKLVSEMMITANETAALFAKQNRIPLFFRGQQAPEGDIALMSSHVPTGPAQEFYMRGLMKRSIVSTTPQSHYGLGLEAYVQSTSPIRRIGDLICQQQLCSFLQTGRPKYSFTEMDELANRIEPAVDEVFGLQRARNRYWLMKYLNQENIRELYGTIVRVDGPKPLIEIETLFTIHLFKPVKPVSTPTGTRLGERVLLKVEANDPRREQFLLVEVARS